MGLIDITSVVLKDAAPSFEKFDVEKNDKALIHIPSGNLIQKFVHVFHREEPVMIERNGRKVPQWTKESFAGTFVCTGKFDNVIASPSYGDPEACPACKAMNQEPRLIERPRRTFAINIVKYATKQRSHELRNNNVEVQVWRHADQKKIEPILMAARQQAIDTLDFMIEADNSEWKKYIIQPKLGEVTYKSNPDLKANMEAAKEDLYDEDTLTEACGRTLTPDELNVEINRLVTEHRLGLVSENGSSNLFLGEESANSADVGTKTTEKDLGTVSTLEMNELFGS